MADFQISNETKSIVSQCKVVIYPWIVPDANDVQTDSILSESEPIDISSKIMSCSFSKSMNNPSGTFEIVLANSTGLKGLPYIPDNGDWKDLIKRGTWCAIYMSQDGDLQLNKQVSRAKRENIKKLRTIGYIERVAVRTVIGDNGELDVSYVVSGRDFGVIYEETVIWHNFLASEKTVLDVVGGLLKTTARQTLDTALTNIHKLFYSPYELPGYEKVKKVKKKNLTSIAQQWILPKQLVADIGIQSKRGSSTFWGDLKDTLNFKPTNMGIAISKMTDFLSGQAWGKLKETSIAAFHELFTEISEKGIPQLNYRPIPWAINKSKYGRISSNIMYYKDLEFILVPAIDVISLDLGEDDQNRYNNFLVTVANSIQNPFSNIQALKGTGFPKYQDSNVKRHGFRPMHVSVNSLLQNTMKNGGIPDSKLLLDYNELLVDYWENAVYAESGRLQKIGSNDIRIGKCLEFNTDTPYASGKRYYIEGYTDTFEVIENGATIWTQDIALTRGFEKSDLQNGRNFTNRDKQFKHSGDFTENN